MGRLSIHCKVMQVFVFFKKLKPYYFRLLAGFLFCVLLVSTWYLFYQKPDYPEEIHTSLQEQLKHIIKDAFSNKEEGIYNLQFQRMQTSVMSRQNRIKAEFQYSFMDKNDTKVTVVGIAQMGRSYPDSETKHDIWLMDQFETKPPVLEFSQPIVLLSSKREELEENNNEDEEQLDISGNDLDNDKSNDESLLEPEENPSVHAVEEIENDDEQSGLTSDTEEQ